MKAILIDDEPLARTIVREYLESYPEIQIAQECNDGFEGVKAIIQHHPDLVFLDIQMPKINGFEMLELVENRPTVIFTTAFDEYAIKAFETHAIDYLLKPFSKERFDKAILKFLQTDVHSQKKATEELVNGPNELPAQNERIVVKIGGKIKIIPINQVLYLEASDDYVKVVTKEGGFLKNKTMAYYEQSLSSLGFVRTHRSYIVNIQEVTRIDPYEKENHIAILKGGSKIPVSKAGYAKLRTVLGL
jgi:two-component system, LytTR family, response regulator